MKSLIKIFSQLLVEEGRYRFEPETYRSLHRISDSLWNMRDKKITKKTLIGQLPFKLSNGVDALVRIYLNPRSPFTGAQGLKPWKSLDPADLYIDLNPKHFKSRRNLYLTLYHEMIHASDPYLSHLWSPTYEMGYNPEKDESYWGHQIEFSPQINEFLEGLVLEFERRKNLTKSPDKIKILKNSLDNIVNYFSKNENLTKISLDILFRINDQFVNPNKISELLANITTNYPDTADLILKKNEDPDYVTILKLIEQYNPKNYEIFLALLQDTKYEIDSILQKDA